MTRNKMYNILLVTFAVGTGLCGVGVAIVTILKNADLNRLRKEEHAIVKAAIAESDRLSQLHDLEMKAANAELKAAQAEMREAQRAYDELNERRKKEIVEHQKEIALLDKQHSDDNRAAIEGKIVGANSRPRMMVLPLFKRPEENGEFYWTNAEGTDPAYNLEGIYYVEGQKGISFGPITLTPKAVGDDKLISFPLNGRDQLFIMAYYETLAGRYLQRLYIAYDKTTGRVRHASKIDGNNGSWMSADNDFPIDSYRSMNEYDRNFFKTRGLGKQ